MEIKLESLGKVQINITQWLFIIVCNCYIFLTFIDIENIIYNFNIREFFFYINASKRCYTFKQFVYL